jgi:glycosyltransferase involved in cell wall biosynthesis
MLQVAMISNLFVPYVGGIETQNRLIAETLVRRGHDVTVLTRRFDPGLPQCEIRNGVRIERFWSCSGLLAKWLLNVSAFRRMALSKPAFDVVLITQFSALVFGPALAGALRHIPLVLRPDEVGELSGEISAEALDRLPRGIRAAVHRTLGAVRTWAYWRAQRVIAISSALAREAQAFGFSPASVVLIPNAVDTGRFRPVTQGEKTALRESLGIARDAEVVLWVGRLVRGKGLLSLIEAWRGIALERSKALLLIVGGGPGKGCPRDVEPALRAAIAATGLHDRVLLAGTVSDVERYLQAGDLFVFSSEQEGFGIALVEAMACGLPVVCTRIEGAAADVVVDGEHGLKFEVGDTVALGARIRALLDDESMRKRMGYVARTVVEQRLNLERVADAYEETFLAVLSEGYRTACRNVGPKNV